jgi:UDP-N-acetyl-D-mannosaminuronate dehydrogenase
MDDFPMLKKKTVAIWGFGYLGYTAALRMQAHGFRVRVFDFDPTRFTAFEKGEYPGAQRLAHWSLRGAVPNLNRDQLQFCSAPEPMFEDGVPQLVAFPIVDKGKTKGMNLAQLVDFFKKSATPETLVMFQSMGVPGRIDEQFCRPLESAGVRCHVGTAFRSDWVVEEFERPKSPQVIAGNGPASLIALRRFFDYLQTPVEELGSIKEAEVYENAKNALAYTATALINQMALGYPGVDFQKIARLLVERADLSGCRLSIGPGGYRMPFSVDALLAGSAQPECFSMLKEAEAVNFSTVLSYSEYLARKGYKALLILGVAGGESERDLIAISPSLALAETMHRRGLKVFVNDPDYSREALKKLLPSWEPVTLESLPQEIDAVLVMSDHVQYRILTQEKVDALFHPNIKLVIDNAGLFAHYRFRHAAYHRVGDGAINFLQ